MACDPNTLLEQAKCLNACIPQGMQQAVGLALLCNIADAGGGGGGEFVLKAGDTMTGALTILVNGGAASLIAFDPSLGAGVSSLTYSTGVFHITDDAGDDQFKVDGLARSVGFFNTGATQQTSGANLTNNVTVGGVNDTIADFTSLTVYATDAAAIRNDIYQLARKLKQVNDALRAYGLLT